MTCNNPDGACNCPNQKFCKWWGSEKKRPGKRKRLAPRSAKVKNYNAIYISLKESYLPGKRCAVFPDRMAGQVHHIKGRSVNVYADTWAEQRDIPLLIDVRFWLPVSQEGHTHIHANTDEARQKGWLH